MGLGSTPQRECAGSGSSGTVQVPRQLQSRPSDAESLARMEQVNSSSSDHTARPGARSKRNTSFSEDQLPPPLDFMPRFIDLGKLATFRVEYQKFRAGNANGAKGEITATTKSEEQELPEDDPWSKTLPPPLEFIPQSVSPRKLAIYRASYQKFRAGDASGAKGEVSSTVIDDDHFPERVGAATSMPLASRIAGASGGGGLIGSTEGAPAAAGSSGSAGAAASMGYSIKNTFVHFEDDGEQEDQSDGAVATKPLGPSLDFIPDTISPEKLEAYRTDYQKFRAGSASGAKGEVSTLAALDLSEIINDEGS